MTLYRIIEIRTNIYKNQDSSNYSYKSYRSILINWFRNSFLFIFAVIQERILLTTYSKASVASITAVTTIASISKEPSIASITTVTSISAVSASSSSISIFIRRSGRCHECHHNEDHEEKK